MASATTVPVKSASSVVIPALYTQALEQAKAALAAQSAPIQSQITSNDATAAQRTVDASGSAAALAKILGQIGPQTQATYGQAADRQTVLAKGYSDGMQAALQKSGGDINSTLNQIGAPAGQQIDPSKATAAGDVLYGLGGYIPASSMNREGAAFTAAANMLPATALLKGQETGKAISMSAQAVDAGLQNKLAELAGNLPGDTQANYDKLQAIALDDAKFAEQVKNDNLDAAFKTASQKLAEAKYNTTTALNAAKYKTSVDEFNTKTTLDYKKLDLAAQKAAQSAFQSDRSYQIALAGLGVRQKNAQVAALAQEYKLKNGGFTPDRVQEFKGVAAGIAENAYKGILLRDKSGNLIDKNGKLITDSSKAVWAAPPVSYKRAMLEMRVGGKKVGAIPVSIAQDALNSFYQPGARGRPMTQAAANNWSSIIATTIGGAGAFAGSPKVAGVVSAARSMLGTPYVWGGNSPGKALDCSGFIQQTFAKIGIPLKRTTYDQVKQGVGVNLNQLQTGDAIFTIPGKKGPEHVGLYIGNGEVQVSPTTGDVNKVVSLQSYLSLGFVAARRYLGNG